MPCNAAVGTETGFSANPALAWAAAFNKADRFLLRRPPLQSPLEQTNRSGPEPRR
jgi:hypothetical protein